MKKIWIFVLLLLVTGCGTTTNVYQEYVEALQKAEQSSADIPCAVKISYDRITEDEIVYQLTLDSPKETMRDITALIVHDQPTNDIFPSIGLADSKMHLIPGTIDEQAGIVKGIILVGYIPTSTPLNQFRAEFKVFIQYTNDAGEVIQAYLIQKI